MKKVVVFILVLLPIFLMVTISIAGQIFAEYVFIPTEGVIFLNAKGDVLAYNAQIKVGKNATADVFYKVLPERATNKAVQFTSRDTSVFTVDSQGTVLGIEYGSADLVISTRSGGHTATIKIVVTDEAVTDIHIGYSKDGVFTRASQYTMRVGEQFTFRAEVLPYTAIDKSVSWSTSEPTVAFMEGGTVTALSSGTAIITVLSRDGGKTDSIELTVENAPPQFASTIKGILSLDGKTVDLINHIVYDQTAVLPENISFTIISGGKYAALNGSVLTVEETHRAITVVASTNIDGVLHELIMIIMRVI